MINADFTFVYWFILGIFTLAAAIQATMVVTNVLRLRNVRLSWKTGKMRGYPLFSTVFLVFAIVAGSFALYQGAMAEIVAAGLSIWFGLCWFTTSHLSTKRYITDHGLVKNVNEPAQTVAWHQVRDFVEKECEDYIHYIFIYAPNGCAQPQDLIRLELEVPFKRRKDFRKLISHKLGRRIRCYVDEDIDVQAFDK